MQNLPESLNGHRVLASDIASVCEGHVRYAPLRSLWLIGMLGGALIGGTMFFSWAGLAVFILATGSVLLFGHSLGSHRKLIHNSFDCPKWLEYFLVYMGVQVGLSGPIGLLRAHDLRDYAQRLPACHDYLRHGRSFWRDCLWQLHCSLSLANPPEIRIEPRISNDRFYRFLEATWMLQQIPPALFLYCLGGWGFVFFGTCARVTAGVIGHWLIGHFAHNQGDQHFRVVNAAVQGHNIRLTSILTMGECWHNNHHAFPGSARLGLFAGEWDPGWWMLLLLHKLGLAWNFRLPPVMPLRPELRGADELGCQYPALPPLSPQNVQAEPSDLRSLWPILTRLRADHVIGAADEIRMEWPAAVMNLASMRHLTGSQVTLVVDRRLNYLALHLSDRIYLGFPAVCLALARRGSLAWLAAAALLPLAVTVERLRRSLSLQADPA
jgi:stearoyl-CoA desaturase (delta-9 desaturase)